MSRHKLTEEYENRVARFGQTFPAAYDFLREIESDGPAHGLWLSTAVNAHLYKGTAFIAYLKLKNPDLRPPSLYLSPHFNLRIAEHTRDESALFFPRRIDEALARHGGTAERWAVRHFSGGVELTANTPPAFFEDLYRMVIALVPTAPPVALSP